MEAEKCMVRHHTCRTRKAVVRFSLGLKAQGWGSLGCSGGPDSVSPSEAREPGALIPGAGGDGCLSSNRQSEFTTID